MEKGKRKTWIGVLIGACLIGVWFYVGILVYRPGNGMIFLSSMALISLIGGLFSGAYISQKVWDGIWYGLLSGIAGAFFIMVYPTAVVIYSLIFSPGDEMVGMLLFFGIFGSLGMIVLAAAGGGIGVLAKKTFVIDPKENQGNSP